MEHWLVTYEVTEEIQRQRVTGFNTCSTWIEYNTTRKTIPIKGSIIDWVKASKGPMPIVYYSEKITEKEYKSISGLK